MVSDASLLNPITYSSLWTVLVAATCLVVDTAVVQAAADTCLVIGTVVVQAAADTCLVIGTTADTCLVAA